VTGQDWAKVAKVGAALVGMAALGWLMGMA